jgi:DNA-binding GntR family transcriptional regulator
MSQNTALQEDGLAVSERVKLSKRVYDEIKSRIIELRLRPGTVLDERSLASELQVSRTPVREALGRLAQDGWIVWLERRRPSVSGIDAEDAHEIFMLRDMIETFATGKIFDELEPRLLAGLLVPYENKMRMCQDDNAAFFRDDLAFHSCIVNFIGNGRLNCQWDLLRGELTRIAIYALPQERNVLEIRAEHEAIIDGFWRGDREKTLNRMHVHREMIIRSYKLKRKSEGFLDCEKNFGLRIV